MLIDNLMKKANHSQGWDAKLEGPRDPGAASCRQRNIRHNTEPYSCKFKDRAFFMAIKIANIYSERGEIVNKTIEKVNGQRIITLEK